MTAVEFNFSLNEASKALKPFALRLTKDFEEANDLVQDTLMKAFLNKEKFTDGTNLKGWLYIIMKNTFITNYQKMVKKNTFIDTTENLYYINSSQNVSINDAISSFAQKDINEAIARLDDEVKVPFELYFKGFKYEEIAKRLKVPLGTVKNRIHIARKELKSKLRIYRDNSYILEF